MANTKLMNKQDQQLLQNNSVKEKSKMAHLLQNQCTNNILMFFILPRGNQWMVFNIEH